ncbi:sodium channel and clathrin linker 1-like isoform X2 [Ptychodera flava]|uniref:sodium channel and clathrin linker 1-like isoform X2 n=1 Tax=Ptychodera flava TaxID=63121 RepID=UPI003969FA49
MDTDQVEFLRDQVHRLNVILSQYQEKYLPIEVGKHKSVYSSADLQAPWLTSKSLLSPLIAEYDRQLDTLREQNNTYKREFREQQSKLEQLIGENKRCHEELRRSIENQLRDTQPLSAGETAVLNEEDVLHNLQQQVQLVTQERDSTNEMLQSANRELDRVRHELQETRSDSQMKAANYQTIQERSAQILTQNQKLMSDKHKLEAATQQFQHTLNIQTAEMEQLREQLQRSRSENRAATVQLQEVRKRFDHIKQEMMRKDTETSQAIGREHAADSRVTQLQAALMDLENQLSNASKECQKLRAEKEQVEEKVATLQKKNGEIEQREYEASVQVRESVQMVENAILEKDQAVIREQQKAGELQRIQDVMNKLINEAGLRTKQEVENVRKQYNNNISKLMDEIHAMEMENAEKQAQMERAIREKRSVEQELEKVYREGLTQAGSNAYQDLQGRLINAERAKDEATMKAQSLDKKVRAMQLSHDEKQSQNEHTIEQLKDRLETLSKETEEISEERLQLLEEIDEYKTKMIDTEKNKEYIERKCLKELTAVEQELNLVRQQYEAKLETMEDSNRQSTFELKQLLGSQQRMSARWREESKTLTEKYESKIHELRGEISELKKRNEDINKQLSLTRQHHAASEQKLADHIDNNRKLNQRLLAAEKRVADANMKRWIRKH